MTQEIEWDESRQNDPAYLAEYYQSVADKCKDVKGAEATHRHFQKAADKARRKLPPGEFKGETCNRDGCRGIIEERSSNYDGCTCFINPPCSYCMEQREYCPECDWEPEQP